MRRNIKKVEKWTIALPYMSFKMAEKIQMDVQRENKLDVEEIKSVVSDFKTLLKNCERGSIETKNGKLLKTYFYFFQTVAKKRREIY